MRANMTFKVLRTLNVALDHLTKEDYSLIEEYTDFIVEYDRYIIIVEDWIEKQDTLRELGFSEGFIKCILMGYVLGCERVEFSYEGSIIDKIPTYYK
jgi:hypothetical protein